MDPFVLTKGTLGNGSFTFRLTPRIILRRRYLELRFRLRFGLRLLRLLGFLRLDALGGPGTAGYRRCLCFGHAVVIDAIIARS